MSMAYNKSQQFNSISLLGKSTFVLTLHHTRKFSSSTAISLSTGTLPAKKLITLYGLVDCEWRRSVMDPYSARNILRKPILPQWRMLKWVGYAHLLLSIHLLVNMDIVIIEFLVLCLAFLENLIDQLNCDDPKTHSRRRGLGFVDIINRVNFNFYVFCSDRY